MFTVHSSEPGESTVELASDSKHQACAAQDYDGLRQARDQSPGEGSVFPARLRAAFKLTHFSISPGAVQYLFVKPHGIRI